jgi:hypothetical protein
MESEKPEIGRNEILSGWKEIARYLGKGVRTVQRYEMELGLPVRRLSDTGFGAVVASKTDLDSWVNSYPVPLAFRETPQSRRAQLTSSIANGLQEHPRLRSQLMALRKELKTNIRVLRESISKVRQELNESRKLQDSISSVIAQYSRVYNTVKPDPKRQKPNGVQ